MTVTAEETIRGLIHRYARAVDRLDLASLDPLFWPDAEVQLGVFYRGNPAGFVEVVRDFMGSMAATRHCVSTMIIDLDGAVAGIESYVDAWHRIETPSGTQVLAVAARYISRAECRDGAWRLSAHSEVMDWGELRAADAAWFEQNAELPKGRRDRDDPSYRVLR